MKSIYKRIIIKVSGEALSNESEHSIFDRAKLEMIADVVEQIHGLGVNIGIVTGAGNIWRGRTADVIGIEQAQADYMGMLGTLLNAMALQNAIEKRGIPYIRRKAVHHLDENRVVIFAGGTGNPYFTTDSCATLRALEVKADAILMAKNGVDGVYDKDPRKDKDAKLIKKLSFHQLIEKKLNVMDLTAAAMLEGKDIVIRVFNMDDPSAFLKVVSGEDIGTTISKEE